MNVYRFLILPVLLLFTLLSEAQKQYALMIAIDDYGSPNCDQSAVDAGGRKVCNLHGCVNDAEAMKAIITTKYGFASANVNTLFNKAASRKNILSSMDALASKCRPGDIAFIFYAGHGSQVINTKSAGVGDVDQLDESIVPADTKMKGVLDIRDKELAVQFNKFLDRNIHLTVIFDCCHSASMSRGNDLDSSMTRYAPNPTYDIKDPSKPPIPENNKKTKGSFLMLSAAQQDQKAQELKDRNNIPHGAFTTALVAAINQLPAASSAIDLMNATRSILITNGRPNQDPTMAGQLLRQQKTLFGISRSKLTDRVLIPVISYKNGIVEFLGGFAQNLQPGNELTMISTSGSRTGTKVKLEKIVSINKSSGKLMSGNAGSIKPGTMFEVTNWVAPKYPLLNVYYYPNQFNYAEAETIKQKAIALKQSGKVKFVDDLSSVEPYLNIFYYQNKCFVHSPALRLTQILDPTPDVIAGLANGQPVYFNLPLSVEAISALQAAFKNKNFNLVSDMTQAQYRVYGILNADNNMAYGWKGIGMNLKDSLLSLPVQTGNIALRNDSKESYERVANGLLEYATRLGRVKYWLGLTSPGTYKNDFPYKLEFTNLNTRKTIGNGRVQIGDELMLTLVEQNMPADKITPKFVYVFTIDKQGEMSLLYPGANDGNQNNKFPKYDKFVSWGDRLTSENLVSFRQDPPVGTNQFYLIATEQPIPDYAYLFEQQGTGANRRGGSDAASDNPFEVLVDMSEGNTTGSRGSASGFTWNLQKYSLRVSH